MSVFVSTTFVPNQSSVIDAIKLLKSHNINNIELGSIHRHEEMKPETFKNLDAKYLCHNFFPPLKKKRILNIASLNDDVRRFSLDFVKKAIEFAERIGAFIYTLHPGFVVDPIEESHSYANYDFNFGKDLSRREYQESFETFLNSIDIISRYITTKNITVAIETQGSVSKKDFLLFSKPEDFPMFLKRNKNKNLGVNLNLGHLNLASNAWGFDRFEIIEMLKDQIKAIEVSHNEGKEDEHEALQPNSWYMEILKNNFFKEKPVIFEGRNLSTDEVLKSYALLQDILEGR